jgi:hypothetical protein
LQRLGQSAGLGHYHDELSIGAFASGILPLGRYAHSSDSRNTRPPESFGILPDPPYRNAHRSAVRFRHKRALSNTLTVRIRESLPNSKVEETFTSVNRISR